MVAAGYGDIFRHGQSALDEKALGYLLIHGDGGRQHARSHIRQIGQFQKTLHGAIFSERSV